MSYLQDKSEGECMSPSSRWCVVARVRRCHVGGTVIAIVSDVHITSLYGTHLRRHRRRVVGWKAVVAGAGSTVVVVCVMSYCWVPAIQLYSCCCIPMYRSSSTILQCTGDRLLVTIHYLSSPLVWDNSECIAKYR
ncbi:hypothetical protein JVT61DRAFT_11375 [Boletus reticuloceps]|uniref:Uncharacterized protein n=1 Tax=Boletus reticuloceps TaxID=495285 RepID=A0A8I3A4Y7_9AGAM|nr:hypothetical protein JVT61DRAFT_11375 [Boletus reticuloceps]